MARITHVKAAQQRYAMVPVIDPDTGEQKKTPVMATRTIRHENGETEKVRVQPAPTATARGRRSLRATVSPPSAPSARARARWPQRRSRRTTSPTGRARSRTPPRSWTTPRCNRSRMDVSVLCPLPPMSVPQGRMEGSGTEGERDRPPQCRWGMKEAKERTDHE